MQEGAVKKKPFSTWPIQIAFVPEDEALATLLVSAIAATGNQAKALNLEDPEHIKRLLLLLRPLLFLVSPAALRSPNGSLVLQRSWHYQAYSLPTFLLLPVLAAPVEAADRPDFLVELPCIGLPDGYPYTPEETVQRTLRVLGMTSDDPEPVDSSLAALLLRSNVFWRQGREPEATACVEAAVQQAPASFGAWYSLGAKLGRAPGREEEAIAAFERAVSLEPRSGHAWGWLAGLYKEAGRLEDTKRAYEQMLICGDEHYPHWEARARILHYELERYAESLMAYEQVARQYPDEVFMYFGMGGALYALERYEEAITAFDKFLARYPDDGDTLYDKALTLSELQRYEEALALFDQALVVYRDDDDADLAAIMDTWFQRGDVLLALKHYEEALEAYDHALLLFPNAGDVWHSKALALRALGREEEARVAEAHAQKET